MTLSRALLLLSRRRPPPSPFCPARYYRYCVESSAQRSHTIILRLRDFVSAGRPKARHSRVPSARTCLYIHTYIYMYVCMYICIYFRASPSPLSLSFVFSLIPFRDTDPGLRDTTAATANPTRHGSRRGLMLSTLELALFRRTRKEAWR